MPRIAMLALLLAPLCGCVSIVSSTPKPAEPASFTPPDSLHVVYVFREPADAELRKRLEEGLVRAISGEVAAHCSVESRSFAEETDGELLTWPDAEHRSIMPPRVRRACPMARITEISFAPSGGFEYLVPVATLGLIPVWPVDTVDSVVFHVAIFEPGGRLRVGFAIAYAYRNLVWLPLLPITPFGALYRALAGDQYDYLFDALPTFLRFQLADSV